jgi:hypothetical protein
MGNHEAFQERGIKEWETMMLSRSAESRNEKPWCFPGMQNQGMGNHDVFLECRIKEWETVMLFQSAGSRNGKPRCFPGAQDQGMRNHDAFLERTIKEWETMMFSFQKGSWSMKSPSEAVSPRGIMQHGELFIDRKSLKLFNIGSTAQFLLSTVRLEPFLLSMGRWSSRPDSELQTPLLAFRVLSSGISQ